MNTEVRRTDAPVTPAVLARAVRAGKARDACTLRATSLRYLPEPGLLLVTLEDGVSIGLPVANYPEFAVLTPAQLARVSLGLQGAALCLDEADLHVSLAGLIRASASLMDMLGVVARVQRSA